MSTSPPDLRLSSLRALKYHKSDAPNHSYIYSSLVARIQGFKAFLKYGSQTIQISYPSYKSDFEDPQIANHAPNLEKTVDGQ